MADIAHTLQLLRPGRWLRAAVHFIVIALVFLLPEMVFNFSGSDHADGVRWGMYGKSVAYICVFYVNYLWLVPRLLVHGRAVGRLIAYNIMLMAATAVFVLLWDWVMRPDWLPTLPPEPMYAFLVRDMIMCGLSGALAVAIRQGAMWLDHLNHQQQADLERRQSELDTLRSQLNPHFLFNSLNTVYALIDVSPERAQEALHSLSDMLRYALYFTKGDVTLGTAARFLSEYVGLMNMRLGHERQARLEIDIAGCEQVTVAPMMSLTLAENVFKHSIPSPDVTPCISLTAGHDRVRLATRNASPDTDDDPEPHGIGLDNLRRRLHLIYGPRATFEARRRDGIFTTQLILNINTPQ